MCNQAVILAISALTTPALADGTATWLYDVTTQDGDTIVEPGETATITLTLLMEPFPGDAESAAIAGVELDVLGDDAAGGGHILGWKVLNNLADLTGDLTTTDGVSLFGVNAGQLSVWGWFTDANPIDVLTFEWAPDEYIPLDVTYTTHSATLFGRTEGIVDVYEDWEGDNVSTPYVAMETQITFTVIPAPAAAIAFLPLVARNRLRSASQL